MTDDGRLDTAGVFETVFDIYRRQAALLLPAAVLVYLIPALADGLIRSDVDQVDPTLLGVTLGLSAIATIWFQGAVVAAVADIRDGRRDHTLGSLFRSVLPVLGPLTVAVLLASLGVAGGLLLLVVPGLVLLTWWSLIAPVIVMERSGALPAFRRSRELVRGNGWRVFGVLVVAILISAIVISLFQALADAARDNITVYSLAVLAGNALAGPLMALTTAVVYLDLRHRKGDPVPVEDGPATVEAGPAPAEGGQAPAERDPTQPPRAG